MRRRPALVTAALACAGLAATALAVAPATEASGRASTALGTYTEVPNLTFTVHVGPGGTTTCPVDADLYVPAGASAAHPVPAILTTNGFGGSKADQAGLGKAFAERGYAVLSYTGLGFPASGCDIYLDDPAFDGAAASQLVSWLGGTGTALVRGTGQPMSVDFVAKDATAHDGKHYPDDPRVGMIGGSYGGQIQFATAAVDPRVDALIPLITWNDLQYSLAPNNTDFATGAPGMGQTTPGTEKLDWTSLFFAVGVLDGLQQASTDPSQLASGCLNFRPEACRAKAQLDALGYPDATTSALTKQVSVGHYISRITVPTLLVQGEDDTLFNLQEAVATYRALKGQGTPVRMIWQSWGHSGGGKPAPGELDLSGQNIENTYLGARFKAWFDHYLKGQPTDLGPQFAYFRPWVSYTGSAAPAYASSPTYPVATPTPLYLSGGGPSGGALVASRRAVAPGTVSWANPGGGAASSYSETSGVQGSQVPDASSPPSDAPGTAGTWTSAPLASTATLVGMPTLDVRFSAPTVAALQASGPANELLLFAKLYDVAPDGSVTLVNRLIAPTRVGDVTKSVHIELPGIVHQVPAGHRLQLVLAATDAAYKNAYPVQPVSVTADPSSPFVLRLPTLGGLRLG